ncbi:MAG: AMP-binding protein [Candidatus Jordarchaeum sp.]|uniref:AMP-binding protein n=1 Tax=Candidatus Jordarchaeum sp. TaxID=2823881 RepID=UPI00404B402A
MERAWFKSWPEGLPKSLDYPEVPIFSFLRDTAKRFPEKKGIIFYGYEVTFGELDDFSDRFANALVDIGVKKGDKVGLFLENCPQFVIAYYGALKAGAIVVPINPMLKEMEVEQQLNDSETETLITLDYLYPTIQKVEKKTKLRNVIVTSFRDYLPEEPTLPIHISMEQEKKTYPETLEFIDLLEKYEAKAPKVNIDPKEDLALLQYSSGTTGVPKAAMITHFNTLVNIIGAVKWAKVKDEDINLSVLPLFHVTGMQESMNCPIYTGSTNVLLSRFDLEAILGAIEKYKCTVWVSVAPINVAVCTYPYVKNYDLSSLRLSFTGGAPVPLPVFDKFKEVTGCDLIEGYGLSETISQVTINPVDKPKYGSVGIPTFDVDAKIVDAETGKKDLAIGEEGEIIFKGPQVMKGYWKQPELTKTTLRDGWLFTGDIAKMDEDGYIYIVGRKKEMIIVSGYKVWTAEVEELLKKHPAVYQVAIVGIGDPIQGESVKAYVVIRPDYKGRITEEKLMEWAKKKMAAYKYPRQIEFVNELPRSGSGKILKRMLK